MTYPHTQKVVLVGQETSYGSGGTANKDVGLVLKTPVTEMSRTLIEVQGAGNLEVEQIVEGIRDDSVTLDGEFQHGRLMSFFFGSVVHATTSSDTKHTFTLSSTDTYARFELSDNATTDVSMDHTGAIGESAEWSISLNETLKAKYNFKTKKATPGASSSAKQTSTLAVFPSPSVHVSFGGVEATEIQEASIVMTREVKIVDGAGSVDHQQAHAVKVVFEFNAKLGFQSNTYHTAMNTGGASTFSLNAHNGVTLGSGRREFKLTLNSYNAKLTETANVGDVTYIDVSGKGTLNECFTVDNIASASWL